MQLLQNVDFDQRLLVEPLLVPDDLDSHKLAELVIDTPDNLSETTLAEDVEDLVPVRQVVTEDNLIVPSIIVVTKVLGPRIQIANVLRCLLGAAKVNVVKFGNLATLKDV